MMVETQLTFGACNSDLDNNLNFSPDGRSIVVDGRGEGGINRNAELARIDVRTGNREVFYRQRPPCLGVGAASYLGSDEVVAIHALTNGIGYDFTERGGMIIAVDGSGRRRWLDSRDVTPPFTPGALRGGTHKHEPDASGRWIGFTYNDAITREHGSDLRNVGVSLRGRLVSVPQDAEGRNFAGESFTVLLTTCVDLPDPDSDQYQRAEGDCWVARASVTPHTGRAPMRAFRGRLAVSEGGGTVYYSDVFIVDIPDDITVPGPLGPLQGLVSDYPKPPAGVVVRRLTRTALNPEPALRGVTDHLRASPDGRWIVFAAKAARGARFETQVFVVSPTGGETRQLSRVPGGVSGGARFSSDSAYVAAATPDGAVCTFSAVEATWGHTRVCAEPGPCLASNVVVSPDSRLIAYNRTIAGVKQVFATSAHPRD